jgi:hypothetical protein
MVLWRVGSKCSNLESSKLNGESSKQQKKTAFALTFELLALNCPCHGVMIAHERIK